jgi:hypothetical protein
MGNSVFHNKWHSFNHYTVALQGYPDSATDPVASKEYPFRGIFYNVVPALTGLLVTGVNIFEPGSGYTVPPDIFFRTTPNRDIIIPPVITANLDPATKSISSVNIVKPGLFTFPGDELDIVHNPSDTIRVRATIFTQCDAVSSISNSLGWWTYYSLTHTNSADWNKYPAVNSTTITLSSNWNLGFSGYNIFKSVSSNYTSVFSNTFSLSPDTVYDGKGGTGWHIALSATTHKTDRAYQIDNRQKVAKPVQIFSDLNNTVTWNTSAQTVFLALTSNASLTAKNVVGATRGGKYTMWVYVDRCPEQNANLIFDKEDYNVSVKTISNNFITTNNVVALTANFITKIDFVYDGDRMLGRASRFRIYAPTQDDLYFQGTGISFTDPNVASNQSPVYLNLSEIPYKEEPNKFFVPNSDVDTNNTGLVMNQTFSNVFTETSSFYVAGSGLRFSFLNGDNQYFNYTLINPEFQSKANITKYRELTGSFDRVVGTLSARGNWQLPQYAQNLLASPSEAVVTDNLILSALPTAKYNGPWQLEDSAIRTVKTCTSSYTVEIFSGKNRDIASILVNDVAVSINPIIPTTPFGSCYRQPYTFLNERTAFLTFERISSDYDIQVTFKPQTPALTPNLYVWMTAQDDLSLSFTTPLSALTAWRSNTLEPFSISRTTQGLAPIVRTEFGVRRYINFSDGRSMQSAEGSSVRPLTALSANNSFMKGFTTFTVFKTLTLPTSSVVWWIGDLNTNNIMGGYGLVLSGGQLFTIGNFAEKYSQRLNVLKNDSTRLDPNTIYVVATKYDPANPRRQEIYVNGVPSIYQRSLFDNTVGTPMNNFNLILGRHPTLAQAGGNFHFYDLCIYDRALSRSEIINMNNFLINKMSLFSNACDGSTATNVEELPPGFIRCNKPAAAKGNRIYPYEETYFIGSGTGWVELEYTAWTVPDRFIVVYGGNVVIDTGYVGSTTFNTGNNRNKLKAALLGKIDPISLNTYPDFVTYPGDGYPIVTNMNPGRQVRSTARFYKGTQEPLTAKLQVWAPGMPGTAWTATLKCPKIEI